MLMDKWLLVVKDAVASRNMHFSTKTLKFLNLNFSSNRNGEILIPAYKNNVFGWWANERLLLGCHCRNGRGLSTSLNSKRQFAGKRFENFCFLELKLSIKWFLTKNIDLQKTDNSTQERLKDIGFGLEWAGESTVDAGIWIKQVEAYVILKTILHNCVCFKYALCGKQLEMCASVSGDETFWH